MEHNPVCPNCGSENIRNKGYQYQSASIKKRHKCRECKKNFYITIQSKEVPYDFENGFEDEPEEPVFVWEDSEVVQAVKDHEIFVITSAQNDTDLDLSFLQSLKNYCEYRGAKLFIIPVRYRNPSAMHDVSNCTWDTSITPYLIENEVFLTDNVKIVSNISIQATAVNPLSGLDPITQGCTTIVGHSQLQMTTVPVNRSQDPVILATTGSVSHKDNYSDSKAGYKAFFNHSNSAIVVECDRSNDRFHMRQLMADKKGHFYDLMGEFTPEKTYPNPIESVPALVTGDEHIMFISDDVVDATYTRDDSLLNRLTPEKIVRHDILDCYTVSHHHRRNPALQFHKHVNNKNNIEEELHKTLEFVLDTTPPYAESIIVESNHNDHLMQWLNETDPKTEIWNAKAYHELMYMVLEDIDQGGPDITPHPLELWYDKYYGYRDIRFIYDDSCEKIMDILISMHGHIGPNGARGSRKNLSKIADRSIIGHSHSPGIEKGCWQVGTSSIIRLEYNKGPSGWMNTHCIIYPNGKRQLINIIQGEYYYEPGR